MISKQKRVSGVFKEKVKEKAPSKEKSPNSGLKENAK